MRHAVLDRRLRRRHLVVALERHLLVHDREDRVRAPLRACPSTRQRGAEPPPHSSLNSTFVPSLLNVAECQKDEVRVGRGIDALRVCRIANVEQQSVAAARAAGEADRRIDGDVMALRRARRGRLPRHRDRAAGSPTGPTASPAARAAAAAACSI